VLQRAHVVERRDAPAGDHGNVDGLDDAFHLVRSDARELALDVDVRKEDRRGAEVRVPAGGLGGVEARPLGPPRDDDFAVLRVEADDDGVRVDAADLLDDCRPLHRGSAEDDALDAAFEQVEGVGHGADTAAQLDGDVDGLEDGLDGLGVLALALEGPVEVDEVEGFGARLDPALGRGDGLAVGSARAALPADELDDLPVLHVHGGDHLEVGDHGEFCVAVRRKGDGSSPDGGTLFRRRDVGASMSSGPLSRLGSWLERLLFGPTASLYRQFVLAIVVVTALLAVANAMVIGEIVAVSPAVAGALRAAGAVALTLFVLAGVIEAIVLARAYERGTQEVAKTAAELESAAADVAETAEDLETAAEDVETAADEVESVVPADEDATAEGDEPAVDPEAVPEEAVERVDGAKERAAEAKSTTESAKETATEAAETAAEQRERVPDGADGDEEVDSDASR